MTITTNTPSTSAPNTPTWPDFSRHNEEVRAVWGAFEAGRPLRAPMVLTSVQRIWVLDPSLNRAGLTWQTYLNDPAAMYEVTLQHRYYVAHHIPQDAEMGLPEKQWEVALEFGNVYEEAWLDCQIIYPEGQIATTLPRYAGAAKYELFEKGLPDPFAGFMGQMREFYEYAVARASQETFHGRPVHVNYPVALNTDGPLTVAQMLRGSQIFEEMLSDPGYFHQLMDFLTEAIIQRIRAWRGYLGLEPRPDRGGFADDAIQFLSARAYREHVLPYHKRLLAGLYGPGPHGVHLCGNVQRHFPTVIQELNIDNIDTGFPLDFTSLRDQVGEGVLIQGGVPVGELVNASAEQIYARTKSILQSGILRGGRFILKEANDLAPCTPLANLQAMYAAVHDFGKYPI
jgi:hypothetical protein